MAQNNSFHSEEYLDEKINHHQELAALYKYRKNLQQEDIVVKVLYNSATILDIGTCEGSEHTLAAEARDFKNSIISKIEEKIIKLELRCG